MNTVSIIGCVVGIIGCIIGVATFVSAQLTRACCPSIAFLPPLPPVG